jgi:apolipoprotein N-acyltransferase
VRFAIVRLGGIFVEFADRYRSGLIGGVLAFAATAAMMFFGNGLEPVWPLLWVAPLPVLYFALRSPWWSGALVTGLAWLTGCLNLWGYMHQLGLPPAPLLGVFGLEATVFALAVLLLRALVLRGAIWSALLSFPALWVTFEFVRNFLWPHGTAGCLAYSQLRFLPFLQLASLAGPWGMSFVLLLFPAGLAIALFLRRTAQGTSRRVLSVTLGAVVILLIFGAIRLRVPQPGPQVHVGLAVSDQRVPGRGSDPALTLQAFAGKVRELASGGAQVIVLQEGLLTMTDSDVAAGDAILQRLSDESEATIVVGVDRESATAAFDQARIYQQGKALASYNKEHLLPPFELNFTPGKALLQIDDVTSKWGVAICKDMDFTGLSRQYGRQDTGLMLVPAGDFKVDRVWHGHMAVMRGVEDGFSVLRAAGRGNLTVSDNRGRILAEQRSDLAPIVTLAAQVPTGHSWTVFQLLGDWFGWVSTGVFAWALTRLVLRRRVQRDRG